MALVARTDTSWPAGLGVFCQRRVELSPEDLAQEGEGIR